jgi:hypothetical protein
MIARGEFWKLYNVFTPNFLVFSTSIGFFAGISGEIGTLLNEINDQKSSASTINSFVNIIGCTSIGIITGYSWPISIPLLSIGAIYNKCFDKS